MNTKIWSKNFIGMYLLVVANIIFFLFAYSTAWIEFTTQWVLIASFVLFIVARIIKLGRLETTLVILANGLTLILNFLSYLKVL